MSYRSVAARCRIISGGGGTRRIALAGYNLAAARAELAWAEGDIHGAVRHRAEAVRFAKQQAETTKALYDRRSIALDSLVRVVVFQSQADKLLIRAQRVARAAGVDVTDLGVDKMLRPAGRSPLAAQIVAAKPAR